MVHCFPKIIVEADIKIAILNIRFQNESWEIFYAYFCKSRLTVDTKELYFIIKRFATKNPEAAQEPLQIKLNKCETEQFCIATPAIEHDSELVWP